MDLRNPAFLLKAPRVRVAIRETVRNVNKPFAKARTRRALNTSPHPLKVEIGGLTPREGWVVTNVNATTRNYLDCTSPWPIADGSVQYVFSDNVIEHIPLAAGRAMLEQAYRAMQPGGVIRIVTPDIRKHVELYLAGPSSVEGDVAKEYREMGLVVEHSIDLIRIPIGSFGHHEGYVYDFEVLEHELKRAGFHSVVLCEMGESEHAELQGLDIRLAQEGAQIVVEATR
ncbi:MAG: class I SAM-dependent methyltransferase [Marmoricola sp.]